MTDAERLARAYCDQREWIHLTPEITRAMQRLIDSGVVTVNPPPDPAEQIRDAYTNCAPGGTTRLGIIRRLIDDGWITPGPRCEQ